MNKTLSSFLNSSINNINSKPPKKSKAAVREDLQRRLENCRLLHPGNDTCADCPEKNPVWASLLYSKRAVGKPRKNKGVFCCQKCCNYHMQLGRDVCEVKHTKAIQEWTEEEVRVMEGSGNSRVNALYEALLDSQIKDSISSLEGILQQNARSLFVQEKYRDLLYFSPDGLINQQISNPEIETNKEEETATTTEMEDDSSCSSVAGYCGAASIINRLRESSTCDDHREDAIPDDASLGYDDEDEDEDDEELIDSSVAVQLAQKAVSRRHPGNFSNTGRKQRHGSARGGPLGCSSNHEGKQRRGDGMKSLHESLSDLGARDLLGQSSSHSRRQRLGPAREDVLGHSASTGRRQRRGSLKRHGVLSLHQSLSDFDAGDMVDTSRSHVRRQRSGSIRGDSLGGPASQGIRQRGGSTRRKDIQALHQSLSDFDAEDLSGTNSGHGRRHNRHTYRKGESTERLNQSLSSFDDSGDGLIRRASIGNAHIKWNSRSAIEDTGNAPVRRASIGSANIEWRSPKITRRQSIGSSKSRETANEEFLGFSKAADESDREEDELLPRRPYSAQLDDGNRVYAKVDRSLRRSHSTDDIYEKQNPSRRRRGENLLRRTKSSIASSSGEGAKPLRRKGSDKPLRRPQRKMSMGNEEKAVLRRHSRNSSNRNCETSSLQSSDSPTIKTAKKQSRSGNKHLRKCKSFSDLDFDYKRGESPRRRPKGSREKSLMKHIISGDLKCNEEGRRTLQSSEDHREETINKTPENCRLKLRRCKSFSDLDYDHVGGKSPRRRPKGSKEKLFKQCKSSRDLRLCAEKGSSKEENSTSGACFDWSAYSKSPRSCGEYKDQSPVGNPDSTQQQRNPRDIRLRKLSRGASFNWSAWSKSNRNLDDDGGERNGASFDWDVWSKSSRRLDHGNGDDRSECSRDSVKDRNLKKEKEVNKRRGKIRRSKSLHLPHSASQNENDDDSDSSSVGFRDSAEKSGSQGEQKVNRVRIKIRKSKSLYVQRVSCEDGGGEGTKNKHHHRREKEGKKLCTLDDASPRVRRNSMSTAAKRRAAIVDLVSF